MCVLEIQRVELIFAGEQNELRVKNQLESRSSVVGETEDQRRSLRIALALAT